MTVLVAPSNTVTNLAAELDAQLQSGQQPRATVGAKDAAFGWAVGIAPVVAGHVAGVLCESLTFNATVVGPSATPAAKVLEGGTKVDAVTLTTTPVNLAKYAGMATWTLERTLATDALSKAVTATLIGQALLAFDADVVAAMNAGAGLTATGTTWVAAILGGVAEVVANGGNPNLLVMSGADYAAAVIDPGGGFTFDGTQAVPMLYGLQVVVSAAVTAGTAYVLNDQAVTVAEHVQSPVVIGDPYTLMSTNQLRLVAEIVAGVVVSSPGGLAEVTKTP